MSLACQVSPISAFTSTNLNNKIECYGRVGERIKRSLGWPLITVEIHEDQINENIQRAIEYFSKYAGYTKEIIVFDSDIYEHNKGIRLDNLFSIHNSGYSRAHTVADASPFPGSDFDIELPPVVYISTVELPSTTFTSASALSADLAGGLDSLEVIDQDLYDEIISFNPSLSASFKSSGKKTLKTSGSGGECIDSGAQKYSNMFDYDILDYRKVIDVTEFEEGSSTGINTLFSIEHTLAQQTFHSYAMGNFGFDLTSWYTMKEFMDTREKMLATRQDLMFDPRTQYLTMYPQPNDKSRFYGVLTCFVERSIRDLIKEQWVQQYAEALCKITVGRVRGKFGSVALLGGGVLNYDLLEEGREEKAELERQMLEGASPGLGDSEPIMFAIG